MRPGVGVRTLSEDPPLESEFIYLILDNAKLHHDLAFQLLAHHNRVVLLFLYPNTTLFCQALDQRCNAAFVRLLAQHASRRKLSDPHVTLSTDELRALFDHAWSMVTHDEVIGSWNDSLFLAKGVRQEIKRWELAGRPGSIEERAAFNVPIPSLPDVPTELHSTRDSPTLYHYIVVTLPTPCELKLADVADALSFTTGVARTAITCSHVGPYIKVNLYGLSTVQRRVVRMRPQIGLIRGVAGITWKGMCSRIPVLAREQLFNHGVIHDVPARPPVPPVERAAKPRHRVRTGAHYIYYSLKPFYLYFLPCFMYIYF